MTWKHSKITSQTLLESEGGHKERQQSLDMMRELHENHMRTILSKLDSNSQSLVSLLVKVTRGLMLLQECARVYAHRSQ